MALESTAQQVPLRIKYLSPYEEFYLLSFVQRLTLLTGKVSLRGSA